MCPTSLISQVLAFNKTNPDSFHLVCQEGCALMNSVNCLHCIISMFHVKSFSACLLCVLLNSKCHSAGAPLRWNMNGTIIWRILKASPQHGQQLHSGVTWLWALKVPWKTGIYRSRILCKNNTFETYRWRWKQMWMMSSWFHYGWPLWLSNFFQRTTRQMSLRCSWFSFLVLRVLGRLCNCPHSQEVCSMIPGSSCWSPDWKYWVAPSQALFVCRGETEN